MTLPFLAWLLGGSVVLVAGMIIYLYYGRLWFECHIAQAPVSIFRLVSMTFRGSGARPVAKANIFAAKHDLDLTLDQLEGCAQRGGDVVAAVQRLAAERRTGRIVTFEEVCSGTIDRTPGGQISGMDKTSAKEL